MAKDPLNLDEAGEWAGLWWLPDNTDERVPGVLRYTPEDGLSLSLIGAFEDRIMSHPTPGMTMIHEDIRTWDVVHGAAERREISLLGCVPKGGTRTMGARVDSPDTQKLTAMTAIIGAHVSSGEDVAFSAAEVSIENLGFWAASSALTRSFGVSDGKLDGTGSMSVEPVEVRSVVVDGTEFRLGHLHTLPFFDHRTGKTVASMRDTAFVRAVPAAPFSVARARETARLVQDLISLATHRAAGVIWLRLEVAGTGLVLPDGRSAPCRYAEVLYSPSAVGKHNAKAIDDRRVFFTCASLPFEEIVPRWCEAHGRLKAATNMILGLRYAPVRFVENNLLTAAGAAEVLHRSFRIDEKPFPQAKFKAMRDAMLTQVPEEFRLRFRGAIRNDPTLQDRLLALAARPDQDAIARLMPDVSRWAKRTAQARNDLAHTGTTPKHLIEELIAIVKVTTAVVILNVLHELGLPAERQREIVYEHDQLRATSRAASEWLIAPSDGA